ncbi:DUF4232 domain-containing protein [Streptomyces sp. LaPpAH-108]|uniref:DUF4232 domain-containing protein n=1 Tax=Streptomyces sp. LaPpAH-108 TaxID=1155714 RepID=UPI00036DD22D|nr:DUF4232 domain-containing protein [Streptomyces sp. LaPpAH-108]
MANSSPSARRGALIAGSVAVLGLLTACGGGQGVRAEPVKTESGTAAPATERSPGASPPASAATATPSGKHASSAAEPKESRRGDGTKDDDGTKGDATKPGAEPAASSRCHTSELRASVGRNDPGAGQENFPVVLTNKSSRTCTVHGYPGTAFVDASGRQLGPDPKRSSGSAVTVTLRPGASAWAGLTFSNPEISGADKAQPAALVVTPPDERDSLKVTWSAGAVPVGGNSSSVFLSVFRPGTQP